jgi:hypothetical protein
MGTCETALADSADSAGSLRRLILPVACGDTAWIEKFCITWAGCGPIGRS